MFLLVEDDKQTLSRTLRRQSSAKPLAVADKTCESDFPAHHAASWQSDRPSVSWLEGAHHCRVLSRLLTMSDGYSGRAAGHPAMNANNDHNHCPDRAPDDRGKHEFGKRTLVGTLVGLFSVGLFLALLLLVFPESEITTAIGAGNSGSGSVNENIVGLGKAIDGNGTAATTREGEGDFGKRAQNVTIASQTEQPQGVELTEQVGEDQLVAKSKVGPPTRQPAAARTEYSVAPLPDASEQPRTGRGGLGADGTSSAGTGGDEQQRELMGVKVKGSIALVCDISGSMQEDFPPLYKELRRKFPKTTPLILVPGCHFPQPAQSVVTKHERGSFMSAPGTENDPHIYLAQNTTDAIIFAVEKLQRRTVMFNCDLQDGGSQLSIKAFEKLFRHQRFTLSGRSLNCNAPKCLLDFIRHSGGDFKVDTISRASAAAVPWGQ